jgi:hypothetical protein
MSYQLSNNKDSDFGVWRIGSRMLSKCLWPLLLKPSTDALDIRILK